MRPNPNKVEEKRRYDVGKAAGLKRAIFILLGDCCAKCGDTDFKVLQIDHVYGGGRQHRGKYGGASLPYLKSVLRDLREDPSKYQLLCANDHARKGQV